MWEQHYQSTLLSPVALYFFAVAFCFLAMVLAYFGLKFGRSCNPEHRGVREACIVLALLLLLAARGEWQEAGFSRLMGRLEKEFVGVADDYPYAVVGRKLDYDDRLSDVLRKRDDLLERSGRYMQGRWWVTTDGPEIQRTTYPRGRKPAQTY